MFHTETKGELARMMPESECCVLSELSAIARSCGRVEIRQKDGGSDSVFEIRTESAASARKIMAHVRSVFKFKPKVRFTHRRGRRSRNQYTVELPYNTETLEVLQELGVVSQKKDGVTLRNGVPWHLLTRQCCLRTYLRGVFLARGYVQNPEKEYHMEFMTDSLDHAKGIVRVAESFNVTPKIVERKKRYMVYVKGGDDVAQLLRVMGAHSAVLTLESVRVLRGVRGDVNRVVNCETANVTKAVDAGLAQVEAIQKINEVIGLRSLAPGLQEIAELRLANPEMTLRELGQMLSPPISKSAVNHRMRRLIHLAKRLNGKAG
ncbi:MAG TPA: DNA-binding protein WhiA [Firmicutes bacterium]|nr:DNA-binding protein WhiA [Bacillota bacterium]